MTHSVINDLGGLIITLLHYIFITPWINDWQFYYWARVIMHIVLILIWINIILMLGHILYQLFKCCCKITAIPERERLRPFEAPEEEEKQKLPTPPPPKIVIAPPKDIVIPSAGVDVEHGTEL